MSTSSSDISNIPKKVVVAWEVIFGDSAPEDGELLCFESLSSS